MVQTKAATIERHNICIILGSGKVRLGRRNEHFSPFIYTIWAARNIKKSKEGYLQPSLSFVLPIYLQTLLPVRSTVRVCRGSLGK